MKKYDANVKQLQENRYAIKQMVRNVVCLLSKQIAKLEKGLVFFVSFYFSISQLEVIALFEGNFRILAMNLKYRLIDSVFGNTVRGLIITYG